MSDAAVARPTQPAPARRFPRSLALAGGALAALVGLAAIVVQRRSGIQPWGPTLADNMLFAQSIPFTLGLGLLVGVVRGLAAPTEAATTARFSRGTAATLWLLGVGFALALVTGAWQYLKGVLDVVSPIPMYLVYRVHYLGATLLLFAAASFLTYWWLRGDRSALVPAGQRIRHLRGLAHELPRPLGGMLAATLGLNMRLPTPERERFTYYEKVVSVPAWGLLLGLILVTGLLKALRYLFPIPGELLYWVSALHVTGFVLLAAALLSQLRYRARRAGTGLVGLIAAALALPAAYAFAVGGLAEKTAHKGLFQQALLLGGGALIGLFALLLLVGSLRALLSRPARA